MGRKIVAVIVQPVYDAEGKLLYQPGDQLAEDHRILKSIPGGTYRHEVVETDDDLLQAEPSGLPHLFDAQTLEGIRRSLRLVDAVTVSTPYLAEQIRVYNPNVYVLPNFVKAGLLNLNRPRRDKLTIGWAAGSSHLIDIVTVADQLRRVLEANPQVDMHFMGYDWSPELHRADLQSAVKRQCRWSNWQADVGEYYKQVDFDIAIAPLADVPFNRSKSDIRAKEMAAMGIPIVAADLLPYHDFLTTTSCRTGRPATCTGRRRSSRSGWTS